jgi:hypothetical protein
MQDEHPHRHHDQVPLISLLQPWWFSMVATNGDLLCALCMFLPIAMNRLWKTKNFNRNLVRKNQVWTINCKITHISAVQLLPWIRTWPANILIIYSFRVGSYLMHMWCFVYFNLEFNKIYKWNFSLFGCRLGNHITQIVWPCFRRVPPSPDFGCSALGCSPEPSCRWRRHGVLLLTPTLSLEAGEPLLPWPWGCLSSPLLSFTFFWIMGVNPSFFSAC